MWWTSLLKPKNIILLAVVILAVLAVSSICLYRGLYKSAAAKVKQQEAAIAAQSVQIAEYKKNIELAKEHQERVVVIERKGAVIQAAASKIKSRDLTDEESHIAADITALFNGLRQSGDSYPGEGGKVLPDAGKAGTAAAEDNTGTAGQLQPAGRVRPGTGEPGGLLSRGP